MSINGATPADYRASDAIVVPTTNLITRSGGSPTVTGEFTLRDKLPSIGDVSIGIRLGYIDNIQLATLKLSLNQYTANQANV